MQPNLFLHTYSTSQANIQYQQHQLAQLWRYYTFFFYFITLKTIESYDISVIYVAKKNSQDVIVLFIDESLTFKNKAVYAR